MLPDNHYKELLSLQFQVLWLCTQSSLKLLLHPLVSDFEDIWEPAIKVLIFITHHLHQSFCAEEAQDHAMSLKARTDKESFLIRDLADKRKPIRRVSYHTS